MEISNQTLWVIVAVMVVALMIALYKLLASETLVGREEDDHYIHGAHTQGILVDAFHDGIASATTTTTGRERGTKGRDPADLTHVAYSDVVSNRPASTRGR